MISCFDGFYFLSSFKTLCRRRFSLPAGISRGIETVGVFVNESPSKVIETLKAVGLTTAQLHGNETPDECLQIRNQGFKVMKAFGIDAMVNWDIMEPYTQVTDRFVFDTKSDMHGGSGVKFNWALLAAYPLKHPFLLSGGITPEDAEPLRNFKHTFCAGFDINSGFETSPALKDINALKRFIDKIKLP
ncbi:MAG: phosphoribosylanthranilate isomerase [Bacteroidetes bacterium]|nr:phosphoribosylanthranilate isomerase [Bacteroidota bacterium]